MATQRTVVLRGLGGLTAPDMSASYAGAKAGMGLF
jgi:hypothetical protein